MNYYFKELVTESINNNIEIAKKYFPEELETFNVEKFIENFCKDIYKANKIRKRLKPTDRKAKAVYIFEIDKVQREIRSSIRTVIRDHQTSIIIKMNMELDKVLGTVY